MGKRRHSWKMRLWVQYIYIYIDIDKILLMTLWDLIKCELTSLKVSRDEKDSTRNQLDSWVLFLHLLWESIMAQGMLELHLGNQGFNHELELLSKAQKLVTRWSTVPRSGQGFITALPLCLSMLSHISTKQNHFFFFFFL